MTHQTVHVLKGALGLKNDSSDSTLDRQAQLLQTVAQSQEESASLALALAAKERMVSELSHSLHDSKGEAIHEWGGRGMNFVCWFGLSKAGAMKLAHQGVEYRSGWCRLSKVVGVQARK
eukprot:scaffold92562_cov18-Tisochrysis_lutea.AAC.3